MQDEHFGAARLRYSGPDSRWGFHFYAFWRVSRLQQRRWPALRLGAGAYGLGRMGSAFTNEEFGRAGFLSAVIPLDGGRGRGAARLRPDWNDGCCVCFGRAVLFGDVCHVVSNRLASSGIRLSDNDLFCVASRAGVWPDGCKQLFLCPSRRLCNCSVGTSDCALQMAKLAQRCSRLLRLG